MPRQGVAAPGVISAQASTFVVAARDADPHIRATSDFVCTGSRPDDEELQDAYDSLPSSGGTLVLTTGTFTLTATLLLAIGKPVVLIGQGKGVTILKLADNANVDVMQAAGVVSNCGFHHFTVDGNKANQTGAGGGIDTNNMNDAFFLDVEIKNCRSNGFGGAGSDPLDCIFVGCISHDNDSAGFRFATSSLRCQLIGCVAENNGGHGFEFNFSTDMMLVGCRAKDNTSDGVRSVGNTRLLVVGSALVGNGAFGINESSGGTDNIFEGNVFNGNSSGPVAQLGNSIARNNAGYKTANSGTATLVNGQTTIVVTHGLDVTPVAGDIMLTPMESLGSASEFFIDTYTATQFTIHVDVDPTQDVDFAWKAVVL